MAFLPDESRSLPPPPLLNKGSLWLGFAGWLTALLDNTFNQRPVLRAGAEGREEPEGRGNGAGCEGRAEARSWGRGCGGFGVTKG